MQATADLAEMARRLNISPESLVEFPNDVRANVQFLMKQEYTTPELTWIRSVIEPFHPQSNGTRTPSNTPKETVSYTHFTSMQCDADCLFLANYEMQLTTPLLRLSGPLASVSAAPMASVAASFNDDGGAIDERVNVIVFGTAFSRAQLAANTTFCQADTAVSSLFIKSRTVAAGLRVWKTSSSENESGALHSIYGRDGVPIDENVSLATEMSRPRLDRATVFLAQGECYGHCRGRQGFTIQNNYRPHDEESFRYRQADRPSAETLFGSQPQGAILWVVSETDGNDGA